MEDQKGAPAEPEKSGWRPEDVVFLAALALLPAIFASGFSTYEALKSGVFLASGAVLLAIWAVRAARGQVMIVRGWLALVPVLGLVIWAACSALWATNTWAALHGAAFWAAFAGFLLTGLAPAGRPIPWPHVSVALAVGALVTGVIGLLQVAGVVVDPLAPGNLSDGLRATFDHERYVAISLACAAPLMAAGLWSCRTPGRVLIGLGLATSALLMGATGVWVAWVLLGFGVLVSVVTLLVARGGAALKPIGPALITLGVAGALIAVGALALDPPAPSEKTLVNGELVEKAAVDLASLDSDERGQFVARQADWGRANPPTTHDAHLYAVNAAWRAFQVSPLLGGGAESWDRLQVRDIDRSSPYYLNTTTPYPAFRLAHSGLLQVAAELGVIAVALLILLLVLVGAPTLRALRVGRDDTDKGEGGWILGSFGLLGSFAAMLLGLGLTAALQMSFTAALMAAVCGVLLRESMARLAQTGFALWRLDPSREGYGAGERFGLAVAPATLAAILALALGVTATLGDYYKARGDVWLRAGGVAQANEAYRQSLALYPGGDLALFNLANLLDVKRERNENEGLLLSALRMRPFDPRLYVGLGELQMQEAASKGPSRDKEFKPEPGPEGKPNMDPMKMLESVDQEIMNRAMANFNQARELHPRYIAVYEQVANAYALRREPDRGQAELLKGLEQVNDKEIKYAVRLHYQLSQSYMVTQDWVKAKKHLSRIMEIAPGYPRRAVIQRHLTEVEVRLAGGKPDLHGHGHGHGHGPPGLPKPGQPATPPLKAPHGHEHQGEGHPQGDHGQKGEHHEGEHHDDKPHEGDHHKGEHHKGEHHDDDHKGHGQ